MGSRGGGRGGGRFGGGGFRFAKQEPYLLYPEIELPPIDKNNVIKNTDLVKVRNRLQLRLKDLPYFLEETFAYEEKTVDIERYSDMKKRGRTSTNDISLENCGYLTLQPGYFPLELVRGTKRRTGKKVVWNPKRDLKKLDFLEVLEGKFKDEDGKKRKEGEESEEEEKSEEEDDLLQEDSDDDYCQNRDFDDDEDEYNQPEDNDDEPLL